MDIDVFNAIISAIGSNGFPIVCCYFMWRYINTVLKEFTVTINENTKILNKIFNKLNAREQEGKK